MDHEVLEFKREYMPFSNKMVAEELYFAGSVHIFLNSKFYQPIKIVKDAFDFDCLPHFIDEPQKIKNSLDDFLDVQLLEHDKITLYFPSNNGNPTDIKNFECVGSIIENMTNRWLHIYVSKNKKPNSLRSRVGNNVTSISRGFDNLDQGLYDIAS